MRKSTTSYHTFVGQQCRFIQHAKLYEKHFHAGQVDPAEIAVPSSVEEMLEYALSVLRKKPFPQKKPIKITGTPISENINSAPSASIVWSAPLYNLSGYGEESRHFVLGLQESGQDVTAQVLPWSDTEETNPVPERDQINALTQKTVSPGFIHITQDFPQNFSKHPQAKISIGRTMFETDRLPAAWVSACNKMDYIWVPSEFNRQTFKDAGVEEEKLVIIPGCLDTRPFQKLKPRITNRIYSTSKPFRFISIFDWTLHKGWDVLLKAFAEAFGNREDIALTLKVWSTMGYSLDAIKQQAESYILHHTSCTSLKDISLEWENEMLSAEELRRFYAEADAFVLPSRGEGWGRPYMEAMACGLPVIGTGWSGNTAFMKEDNSYLIEHQVQPVSEAGWHEIPTYRGHRWAEPSTEHLIRAMQEVVHNPEGANAIAQNGREYVLAHFDRKTIALQIQNELERINNKRSPSKSTFAHANAGSDAKQIKLCWEGAIFSQHSLGLVNREITSRLIESTSLEVSLSSTESTWFDPMQSSRDATLQQHIFAPLSGETDITVRHFYPPRFDAPEHGKFVLMQPWEYGYLPTAWINPIRQHVDEVWCYSNYVKDVYLASGIDKEILHVIPLGVNTKIFHPKALPYVFTDEAGVTSLTAKKHKPFIFLFVGGSLHRKGIDLLLNAYSKAFTALDDVCLIIKDTGTETVYKGGNERERILQLIQEDDHSSRPAMIYLNDDLPEYQLSGLYTASDCLVQPYRGEGFCLPVLEAMACGIPVIVPRGGPTDDFVDDETGWLLDASRQSFGILPGQPFGRVGQWDCAGPTWQFEINEDELARQLRHIYSHQNEAKERGEAAARKAQQFTWENTTEIIQTRLESLANQPSFAKKDKTFHPPKYFSCHAPSQRTLHQKPTLSLCMIVRDEERVLGDCLESVKLWVDEIIVVDTGSTDRTVEIAKEHGACVYHFPWCDDFSAARNVSIEYATGDWIFWMDADDTIPESCGRQLRTLIEQAEDRTTGYMMQVHIPPAPGENGFTIVDHVKIFRNLPELRFIGRIHEQILEPIHSISGRVERTDLYVVHSGYDYSEAGQQKKRARDLTLLEKDLAERPGHPFVLFNIGMTAHHMKEWDKAIEALNASLQNSKPAESTVRKAHAMLAGSYLGKGDVPNAVQQVQTGLGLFPHDPELLFRAGIIYEQAGELERSERAYLTLLTNREMGHIDSLDVSMTTYKAHHNLGALYQRMRRLADAETQFKTAVEMNPHFTPSWQGLTDVLYHQGKIKEAEEAKIVIPSCKATVYP